MKHLLTILIFASFALLQSCIQKNDEPVADETAKKVFSANELAGIIEMIAFVDQAVCDSVNTKDVNQAYHIYFDKLDSILDKGEYLPALLKDTVKFRFLESLNKEAFDAIWAIHYSKSKVRYKDTIILDIPDFMHFSLNITGSYLNYLEQIGKTDSFFSKLHEIIGYAGDLPASYLFWFPKHDHEFDFNTFKDRLFATIFILSFGDTIDEKVERYFRDKNSVISP